MELYRVLLADDEEEIRAGISRTIDWESLGFELTGEADNGRDALELAEAIRPHVVLTDIKMPFLDGLELCRLLAARLPATKFVVFSGFDDFEFAKQAIQMNVSEYILKPINAAELAEVLKKLRAQLDAERAERQDQEALRRRYEESLPVLRGLFFSRLLDGHMPPDQVAERAARLDIDLRGGACAAALIHLDGAGDRRELLSLSVQQLFDENLRPPQDGAFHTFLYNDAVALVAVLPGEDAVYPLMDEIGRVSELVRSYLGQPLTVGVGLPCAGPEGLGRSAEEARSALDYRVLIGGGRVIYIGDLEPDRTARLAFEEEDQRALAAAVKLGTRSQVETVVQGLMERVGATGLALGQCHLFFLELTVCLTKLARSGGLEVEDVFGPGFTGAVSITEFSSLEELGGWCRDRCLRLWELLGRQRTDSAWRTVEEAKSYIDHNYADSELSVESLCTHLHLSPAYFSTLFKRETGMSFTAYVTNVRMERAAALLRETDEKTYRIAEETGYTDPNYFSYVFRRRFGVSPSKYRAGGE